MRHAFVDSQDEPCLSSKLCFGCSTAFLADCGCARRHRSICLHFRWPHSLTSGFGKCSTDRRRICDCHRIEFRIDRCQCDRNALRRHVHDRLLEQQHECAVCQLSTAGQAYLFTERLDCRCCCWHRVLSCYIRFAGTLVLQSSQCAWYGWALGDGHRTELRKSGFDQLGYAQRSFVRNSSVEFSHFSALSYDFQDLHDLSDQDHSGRFNRHGIGSFHLGCTSRVLCSRQCSLDWC